MLTEPKQLGDRQLAVIDRVIEDMNELISDLQDVARMIPVCPDRKNDGRFARIVRPHHQRIRTRSNEGEISLKREDLRDLARALMPGLSAGQPPAPAYGWEALLRRSISRPSNAKARHCLASSFLLPDVRRFHR
jgi:hypothetical protein